MRHPFIETAKKASEPCPSGCRYDLVLRSWKMSPEDEWCPVCGWTRKERVGPHDCGDFEPEESGVLHCANCYALAPNQWTKDGTFLGMEGVRNPALADECRKHFFGFLGEEMACAWCQIPRGGIL